MNLSDLLNEHPVLELDLFNLLRVNFQEVCKFVSLRIYDNEAKILLQEGEETPVLDVSGLQQIAAKEYETTKDQMLHWVHLLIINSVHEGYIEVLCANLESPGQDLLLIAKSLRLAVLSRIQICEKSLALDNYQTRLRHQSNQLSRIQDNFEVMSEQNLSKNRELERLFEEKSELLNQVLQRARMLDLLQDVNYQNEAEFLSRCCSIISEHLHAASSLIWMLDRDNQRLLVVYADGVQAEHEITQDLVSGVVGRCFQLKESLYSNGPDLQEALPAGIRVPNQDGTIQSVLVTPIEFRQEAIGVLQIFNKSRGFEADDLKIASDIARSLTSHLNIHKLISSQIAAKMELESLLATIPDVVYKIDPNGMIRYLSPAIETFGYKVSDLVGKHFDNFIRTETYPSISRPTALENSRPGSQIHLFDERRTGPRATKGLEIQIKPGPNLKHNSQIYGEVNSSGYWQNSIRNTPEFRGSIGIIRDITNRKAAESSLVRVREDKAKLEAQLLQLQKMEIIGTLAGGIAHDFNNILQPILGYTYLLLQATTPESNNYGYLNNIWTAANRARDLVKQILTLSRQAEFQRTPFDLKTIINEVVQLIRASSTPDISFRVNLAPVPLVILGDPSQIHQVLMNLCTNACHAMIDCGGTLEISADVVNASPQTIKGLPGFHEAPHIRLLVRDEGHGMDKVTQERIFEPFFTTKKPGEGTGLGLSVVHGIVANHSGLIQVQSVQNTGTTFTVYIPCHMESVENPSQMKRTQIQERGKILFVDDEEIITQLGKDVLERFGYEVDITTDSLEALKRIKDNPSHYDLLITDNFMPNLTGIALVESVRSINPDLPVILTTGNDLRGTSNKLSQYPKTAYLFKPISSDEMYQAIQSLLKPQREGR
ncbi:MAG: response regulator [Candidatus Cloacimonetes bacterium]|nr:response regulator [Candidatus Cloacimonadota bacterium]